MIYRLKSNIQITKIKIEFIIKGKTKMRKIISVLFAYSALGGTAFSQQEPAATTTCHQCCPQKICYFDGFYIGGQLGVSSLKNKESTANPPEIHTFGDTKFAGGGLAGYDFGYQMFKMGIEGFFNGQNTDAKAIHNQNNTRLTFKNNYTWGFRALPGLEVTPGTVAHLIVGYANGHFKLKDNGAYVLTHKNYHKSGLQLGAGIKTLAWSNFVLRLDALYTLYGKKSYNTVHAGDFTPDKIHNKAHTLEAFVVLAYKF